MSKARNVYSRERDRFRRELQWQLRTFEGRPITFDIKQQLRFCAADLKRDCLDAYRKETSRISNNQQPLIGSNLRLRSMLSSDTTSRYSSTRRALLDDDEECEYSRSRYLKPSVPISKLTYDRHRTLNTNTHVMAFERQLSDEIDRMIGSIEQLNDDNQSTWLQIAKSDNSQYFSSRYDDCRYSAHSYTSPAGYSPYSK